VKKRKTDQAAGLSDKVLLALDMAVLRRLKPRQYQFSGLAPDFYSSLFPASAEGSPCDSPWEFSPMLDYFLGEAEEFFAHGAKGACCSGFWLEGELEGREIPLTASARQVDGISFIVIHAARDDYTERARILRQARLELLKRLKADTDLDKYKEKVLFDALTKIYCRGAFTDILNEQLANQNTFMRRAQSSELAMLMLDIDHFKTINDDFGHLAGDSVLIQLGEILRTSLRTNDTPIRYGGEEFIVIAPNTSLKQSKTLAEKLRQTVASHDFGLGRQITVSIGCAVNHPDDHPDQFIHRADQALYEAKNTGRNKVCAHL